MRDNRDINENLDRQIRELQKEIAELSSLLALKKLESEHPHLEKLVNELSHARQAVKKRVDRIEDFGREQLGEISLGKSLSVLGGIFLIGSVGYAILSAFGVLGTHRH